METINDFFDKADKLKQKVEKAEVSEENQELKERVLNTLANFHKKK